jgi:hypothetical protein
LGVLDGKATLTRSIWNWSMLCKSQYWIRGNRVFRADQMSDGKSRLCIGATKSIWEVLRPSLAGCRCRRCAAVDQFANLVRQDFVVNDIKQATPTVLAAAAIGPDYGSLLIHVPENRKVIFTGRRYADLGVVEIKTRAALEAKDRAAHSPKIAMATGPGLSRPSPQHLIFEFAVVE